MPILNKALLTVSGLVAEAQTLAFSTSITPDMTNSNNFIINIPVAGSGGANFTLNGPTVAGSTPSSAYDMAIVVFRIAQPSDVARTITLPTTAGNWNFGTDIPSVTLTTTLSATDYLAARWNNALGFFDVISFTSGL